MDIVLALASSIAALSGSTCLQESQVLASSEVDFARNGSHQGLRTDVFDVLERVFS